MKRTGGDQWAATIGVAVHYQKTACTHWHARARARDGSRPLGGWLRMAVWSRLLLLMVAVDDELLTIFAFDAMTVD